MTKEEIEKMVLSMMQSGKYPVASLDLFSFLDSLYISDVIKGQIEYTFELYEEYLKMLKENLSTEEFNHFLNALKKSDVVDNQSLEAEDPFEISLFSRLTNDDAIDTLISTDNKIENRNQFIYLHDKLLDGTKSERQKGIREDYLKFVGRFDAAHNPIISYFPLPLENIEEAIYSFLNVYNINKYNDEYEAILKPIIYHGLIAALQLFKDGNTRYGRLLQHSSLWHNLNTYFGNVSMPIIYATRQYFPYRDDYRALIKDIVVQNDDDAWSKWFTFNLRRVQDSIYNAENNAKKIMQRTRM